MNFLAPRFVASCLRCSTVNRSVARRAFTLIELLTVIAIIGILAAIIIPTVGKVRNTAQSARCVSNLRQIGQHITLYAGDNKGRLPDLRAQTVSAVTSPRLVDSTGRQLAYRLWPYYTSTPMKMPPGLNGVSIYPPLICPSLEAEFAAKPLNVSFEPNPDQGLSYIINDRQKYTDASGVNTVFGYYAGTAGSFNLTTIEKKLVLPNESTALSTIWSLQDGDRTLTGDGGASRASQTSFMAEKPAHGSSRNRLYLDGSVRKLTLAVSTL